MVQILPENPSFGALIGRNLGAGLGQGVNQAAAFAQQLGLETHKKNLRKQLISDVEQGNNQFVPQGDISQKFIEALPQIENELGRELTPEDLDNLWSAANQSQQFSNKLQKDPLGKAKAYAAAGEHDLMQAATQEAKFQEKRESEERGLYGESAKEFWKKIGEDSEKIPDLENSLEAQIDSIMKGDVDPWSRGHIADIAKALGAPSSLVAPLETPGSKKFKTGLKTYLSTTLKDSFRGATTGREIDLAEGLLAQAGATREGNLASAWLLQSNLMLKKEKVRLSKDLKRAGYSAYDIPDLVEEQLQPIREDISHQYFEAIEHLRSQ